MSDIEFESLDIGPVEDMELDDIELKDLGPEAKDIKIFVEDDDIRPTREIDSKKWTSWLQRKNWTKPVKPYKLAFYIVLVLAFVFFVAFVITLITTGLVHWGW